MTYKKINPLTSLRFFGAAMIVLGHSGGLFGLSTNVSSLLSHAVSFFFVLSGFILAYVYPSLSGSNGFGRFLLGRFARIWPVHVASFVLLLLLLPSFQRSPFGGGVWPALANLFLVHAWIPLPSFYFSYNAVSWCTSAVFFFYLCFPFLICRLSRTWLVKLLLAFALVIVMVTTSNLWHLPADSADQDEISKVALVYIHPLSRMLEFVFGMSLTLIWRRMVHKRFSGKLSGTMMELVAVGTVVACVLYTPKIYLAGESLLGTAGAVWISRVCSAPFLGLLIIVIALESGLISRLLSFPLAVFLGELSYSVFLLHQILLRYYRAHDVVFSAIPGWIGYITYWSALLLLAHLMWYLIEEPCRKLLTELWPKKSANGADFSPIQPIRKRLSQHFTTAHRWIVWESCIVFILILLDFSIVNYYPQSHIHTIDTAYADNLATKGYREVARTTFGDRFVLRGMDIMRSKEALVIELAWESMQPQRLKYMIAMHLLDAKGNILHNADFPQDIGKGRVGKRTLWKDVITIRNEKKLEGVKAVGLAIYLMPDELHPIELLPIDRGPRDFDNKRLVVTIK